MRGCQSVLQQTHNKEQVTKVSMTQPFIKGFPEATKVSMTQPFIKGFHVLTFTSIISL